MTSKVYVRYVRGNTLVGVNDFEVSTANTVIDRATGLEWMKADSGSQLDWVEALEFCEDLTLDGYDDWRLPDAHEIQSIVDYTRSPDTHGTAAIDTTYFDATMIQNENNDDDFGWYWSSTTHLDGKDPVGKAAVYVAFGRATGNFTNAVLDVHGAGAQRSDPKVGPNNHPYGLGFQGDFLRINNFARCVQGYSSASPSAPTVCPTAVPPFVRVTTATSCTRPNIDDGVMYHREYPAECRSICIPNDTTAITHFQNAGWTAGVCTGTTQVTA